MGELSWSLYQGRFASLVPSYFKRLDVLFLCYCSHSPLSFDLALVNTLKDIRGVEVNAPIVLLELPPDGSNSKSDANVARPPGVISRAQAIAAATKEYFLYDSLSFQCSPSFPLPPPLSLSLLLLPPLIPLPHPPPSHDPFFSFSLLLFLLSSLNPFRAPAVRTHSLF